jgi:hypothetical protein
LDELAAVGIAFRRNVDGFLTTGLNYKTQHQTLINCVLFLFTAIADVQIRLTGSGNNIGGRVEIFHPDFGWGTVCDDSWDITDSNVLCRQLGFTAASAVRNRAYGVGRGRIFLDNVGCNGDESHIWDCSHRGWNKHDCSHREDAGVDCSCMKGYIFDGARCVGMYPLMYYRLNTYVRPIIAQMP